MSPRTPTTNGKPITDDTIQRLADQAKTDYDTEALKRAGGRPPMGSAAARVVTDRLDPELDDALQTRAETADTITSGVIRDALRAWLKTA